MSDRTIGVLIGFYLLGVILVFGYASNDIEPLPQMTERPIVGGMMAAIVWPLYLSHKAFERKAP